MPIHLISDFGVTGERDLINLWLQPVDQGEEIWVRMPRSLAVRLHASLESIAVDYERIVRKNQPLGERGG